MTQRFTVHLERVNVDRITVGVAASGLAEARTKALEHIRAHPESWVTDRGSPLVRKIEAHAKPEPDWSQQDASQATIVEWMKANAQGYTRETLAWAAHEHFRRPFHIDVLRSLVTKALSAGPG